MGYSELLSLELYLKLQVIRDIALSLGVSEDISASFFRIIIPTTRLQTPDDFNFQQHSCGRLISSTIYKRDLQPFPRGSADTFLYSEVKSYLIWWASKCKK